MVFCIIAFNLSASSGVKTTFPLAAPGDAINSFAITSIFSFSSKLDEARSKEFGSILKQLDFLKLIFL